MRSIPAVSVSMALEKNCAEFAPEGLQIISAMGQLLLSGAQGCPSLPMVSAGKAARQDDAVVHLDPVGIRGQGERITRLPGKARTDVDGFLLGQFRNTKTLSELPGYRYETCGPLWARLAHR